jgi:hypothetical protein
MDSFFGMRVLRLLRVCVLIGRGPFPWIPDGVELLEPLRDLFGFVLLCRFFILRAVSSQLRKKLAPGRLVQAPCH